MKVIKLRGNPNIRDIGGQYKDVHIKEGMLIRGRTLRYLTREQQYFLINDIHLRTIIDLRSQDERLQEPELIIPKTNYIPLAIFERQKAGISHTQKEKDDHLQIYRTLPTMDQIYYDMLHNESLKNIGLVIKRIINASDEDYVIYFHCSEGKDRTGLISAILLSILGVSRKEIVKEYLITNKTSRHKAFRYYMRIKYVKFDRVFALKVGRTFLAKKKYIDVLFDVIDNEYGSLYYFLYRGLRLSTEDIDKFKKKLII